MKIRALIVDDEALARARIRKLLSSEQDVEILGESANGPEAIEFIKEHEVDLIFLDVQMPEVSGFDVLRALGPDRLPAVIFVTAHDQHAVAAFEVHAQDYLLKPFTQARLLEAVQRVRQQMQNRDAVAANRQLLDMLRDGQPESKPEPYMSRFAIKNGSQTLFVKVEDVDYLESAANYVVVAARTEKHIVRDTLTNLESRLSPAMFVRISRSVMVNLDRVKGIQSTVQGESVIVLQDGRQLVMTRGVREVQERLQYGR